MRWPASRMLAVAAGLLAAVAALWTWLELVGPLPGERAVLAWQDDHPPWRMAPDVFALLEWFADLGTPTIATLLVAGVAAVALELAGPRVAVLVPAAAAVVLLTTLLKVVLGPTPLWASAGGHANFPSGHTAFATALFGLLAALTAEDGQRVAPPIFVALAAGMGVAMVVRGAHLPSDVLAGWAVGAAWTLALLALARPWAGRR